MQVRTILFLTIFALSVLISGCGNSGSEPATEIALGNARAVDPYLMNATFTEYDAEGKELQTSDKPSAKNGTFWFQIPVTVGSTVKMDSTAAISHVLYDNTQLAYNGPQLQRKVTRAFSEDEEFIISPMTTLAALLMDKAEAAGTAITEDDAIAQIVSLLKASGLEGVTAENLFNNPMGVFTEDMTSTEITAVQDNLDQTLVQANMAVAVALKSVGALPDNGDLDVPEAGNDFNSTTNNAFDTVLVEAVKTLQKYMEDETQTIDARLKQGLIASSDIIETVIGADDFSSATVDKKTQDAVERAQDLIVLLEDLVAETEEQQENEVVIITEDNQVETKNYQELFDAAFPAAMALVDPTLSGAISLAAPADLVTLANKFDKAKSIHAEDRAKYDEAVAKADAAFVKYDEDYLAWEAAGSDPATEPTYPALVTYVPISVSQADLDALNFYYAFSRVMLLANPLSDSNPDNGLQTLGDVLDELDVDKTQRVNLDNPGIEDCVTNPISGAPENCTSTVFIDNADGSTTAPANTPTGAELQVMLYQSVAQELKSAVKALNDVSDSFQMVQTVDGDFTDTDFDYADVLFIKTYANALLFQIHMQQGLVINVDIKELVETSNMTVEEFLVANPDILATKDAAALEKAREYATLALKGLSLAIDIVKDEELADTFQDDDLVSFYYDTPAEIDLLKTDIADALGTLYGQKTFEVTALKDSDRNLHDVSVLVSLTNLFDGLVSLDTLLPSYSGNLPGLLPDATLGGIVADAANSSDPLYLNADTSKDGSPNKIEYVFYDPTNYNGEWTCSTYYSDSAGICEGYDVSWVIYNDAGTVKIDYKNGTDWAWDSATGFMDPDSCVTGDAGLHTTDITSEVQEADLVNLWFTDAEISGNLSGASSSIYDPFTDFYVEYFYLNGGVYGASCYRDLD